MLFLELEHNNTNMFLPLSTLTVTHVADTHTRPSLTVNVWVPLINNSAHAQTIIFVVNGTFTSEIKMNFPLYIHDLIAIT